jgi:hypothetical protein
MQQIAVTHGFVKKLARNVRAKYARDVRHTEIIELIADALGFKAGPLMHALKHIQIQPQDPEADPQTTPDQIDEAGWHLLEQGWKHVLYVNGDDILNENGKKHIAFILTPAYPEGALLVSSAYERHPDTSATRQHLRRKGWSSEQFLVEQAVVDHVNKTPIGGASLDGRRPTSISTQTSSVAAVENVLLAIRERDDASLPLYMSLLAPTSAVAKFALAYAHRLQADQDTRTAVVLLLDAFVEEPFFVELAASSVVRNAITSEGFSRFEKAFRPILLSEVLGGSPFPRKMLAWAASHAVSHGFLAFDGDHAIVKSPTLSPKTYGYKAQPQNWSLNDDGLVIDGREAFLGDLCRKEVAKLANTMDRNWKSPDQLDVAPSVIRVCEQFASRAVVGGAWPSEKVAEYVKKTVPRLLAAKYDKPY